MARAEGQALDADLSRVLTEELEHLLACPAFARSPVQSRLLTYLVQQRLSNKGPAPKAYAIATEALGRPADFDPSIDSYPRVMVGRLRALLDRHYTDNQRPHRLTIPQGSYDIMVQFHTGCAPWKHGLAAAAKPIDGPKIFVPAARSGLANRADRKSQVVETRASGEAECLTEPASASVLAAAEKPADEIGASGSKNLSAPTAEMGWNCGAANGRRRRALVALAMVIAALIGGGAAWLMDHRQSADQIFLAWTAPSLVAKPLIDIRITAANPDNRHMFALQRSVGSKMRDALGRFEMLDLAADEIVTAGPMPADRPDYIVDVMLSHARQGAVYAAVSVNRTEDRRLIWSRRVELDAGEEGQLAALDALISQIGGDYGVIVRDQTGRAPADYRAGYPCLAQFNRLRIAGRNDGRAAVAQCLQQMVAAKPRDAMPMAALSMMAMQHFDQKMDPHQAALYRAEAHDLAARAYAAEPASAQAIFAQARASFYTNDCGPTVAFAARASAVNAYDADMTARLGAYLAICGETLEGERLLRRSIALDDGFPAVATISLALILAEKGAAEEALKILTNLSQEERAEGRFVAIYAMALARAGQIAEARQQWQRLIALAGMDENARAETVLRRFTLSDLVVQREVAGLRLAGVVPDHIKD